jgi:AraC family transcriptional regulator, transcriptional activator of pobA
MTRTRLNRVTRVATGDTASHLILNRMIREARRNLVYANLPVSMIATGSVSTILPIQPGLCRRDRAVAERLPRADFHGEEA